MKVSFAGRAACTALHCTSCTIQLCLRTLRSIAWGVLGRAVRPAGDCTGAAARGGGVQGGLTESRRPQRGPHHSIVATRVETDQPCDTAPFLKLSHVPHLGQSSAPSALQRLCLGNDSDALPSGFRFFLHLSGQAHGVEAPLCGSKVARPSADDGPPGPTPPHLPPPSPPPGPPQAAPQRWGQPDPEGLPPHGAS